MLTSNEQLIAFNDLEKLAKAGCAAELDLLLRKYDYRKLAHRYAEKLRHAEDRERMIGSDPFH